MQFRKNPRPKNSEAIKQALYILWKEFPAPKLGALVASMPKIIKAILKAKGGLARWYNRYCLQQFSRFIPIYSKILL